MHTSQRNNCQHCWRLSKEAMHSGTISLKKNCNVHAQTFHVANIVVIPCKRVQRYCATLHRSQNNRNVGTCCVKRLTGFKLCATSASLRKQTPFLPLGLMPPDERKQTSAIWTEYFLPINLSIPRLSGARSDWLQRFNYNKLRKCVSA